MPAKTERKPHWPARSFQPPQRGEANVLFSVLDYLKLERIPCMRVTAGRARVGVGKAEHWVTLADKGTADVQASIPVGRMVRDPMTGETVKVGPMAFVAWIETKTRQGRLSPDQVAFQQQCQRDGALYIVARSIDDVRDVILPRIQQGLFTAPVADSETSRSPA